MRTPADKQKTIDREAEMLEMWIIEKKRQKQIAKKFNVCATMVTYVLRRAEKRRRLSPRNGQILSGWQPYTMNDEADKDTDFSFNYNEKWTERDAIRYRIKTAALDWECINYRKQNPSEMS